MFPDYEKAGMDVYDEVDGCLETWVAKGHPVRPMVDYLPARYGMKSYSQPGRAENLV